MREPPLSAPFRCCRPLGRPLPPSPCHCAAPRSATAPPRLPPRPPVAPLPPLRPPSRLRQTAPATPSRCRTSRSTSLRGSSRPLSGPSGLVRAAGVSAELMGGLLSAQSVLSPPLRRQDVAAGGAAWRALARRRRRRRLRPRGGREQQPRRGPPAHRLLRAAGARRGRPRPRGTLRPCATLVRALPFYAAVDPQRDGQRQHHLHGAVR